MILSIDIPRKLHEQIESDKRKTGLSKSDIARQIIMRHYELKKELKIVGVA